VDGGEISFVDAVQNPVGDGSGEKRGGGLALKARSRSQKNDNKEKQRGAGKGEETTEVRSEGRGGGFLRAESTHDSSLFL
jgi:hypothetical protein